MSIFTDDTKLDLNVIEVNGNFQIQRNLSN